MAGKNIEELRMKSCDWPIPSLSISLRNCTIDKASLSIAMAINFVPNTVIPASFPALGLEQLYRIHTTSIYIGIVHCYVRKQIRHDSGIGVLSDPL